MHVAGRRLQRGNIWASLQATHNPTGRPPLRERVSRGRGVTSHARNNTVFDNGGVTAYSVAPESSVRSSHACSTYATQADRVLCHIASTSTHALLGRIEMPSRGRAYQRGRKPLVVHNMDIDSLTGEKLPIHTPLMALGSPRLDVLYLYEKKQHIYMWHHERSVRTRQRTIMTRQSESQYRPITCRRHVPLRSRQGDL